MIKSKDSLITQLIAAVSIYLAANVDSVSAALNKLPIGFDVIIPVGVFLFLHKGLLWLYRNLFWHDAHSKEHLNGSWVYILTTNEGARVYGHFRLIHNWEHLKITDAETWYFGETSQESNKRGIWKSNHVSVIEKECHVVFTMTSLTDEDEAQGIEEYRGALDFHIYGEPVTKLEGKFRDFGDRNQFGSVIAKRVSSSININALPSLVKESIGVDPLTEEMYK